MLARVGFAVLVPMVLGGLASAATLAQSPSPTPTATATPVGCDFPTPTPAPGETPYPGSTATAAPTAPTDLRAELVADPELASGLAVQLSWQDNADNETCYQVMVRIDGEPLRAHGGFVPYDASTTGPQTLKDIPDRTGLHCYQVYYGNSAGRSYSNEACIDVQAVPVVLTPTPPTGTMTPVSGARQLPPACLDEGPVGSPGSPSPPTNLRAELMSDASMLEGYVVRLEWSGGTSGALCHIMERRVGAAEWSFYQGGSAESPVAYDIPQEVGTHCYRIALGNDVGRSEFSNEVCVDVEILPVFVTPTQPPWPCGLGDTPPYSELGPPAPTNLQALLVSDDRGLRVDLAWQDNTTGELCWGVERRGVNGAWQWFGGGEGDATIAIDGQPSLGDGCYRTWVANEHGRSAYSNEACAAGSAVSVTPTPITTPVPSVPVTPAALPFTGGGPADAAPSWWWALAGAGSAFLGLAALSLTGVGRRRRQSSR